MKQVSIVIPVKNEAVLLQTNIGLLVQHLTKIGFHFEIIIVENGSIDNTLAIAHALAASDHRIKVLSLQEALFGEAIKVGCMQALYSIFIYSIDLTMGLDFIEQAYVLLEKYPIVNGSRFMPDSVVERSWFRQIASKVYHPMACWLLGVSFTDFDGLKAMRCDFAKQLLPHTRSKRNFFFTEMLVMAERNGVPVAEIPIDHIENRSSRFSIPKLVFWQVVDLARYYRNTLRSRSFKL